MKRFILLTTAIVVFVGFIALPRSTWSQNQPTRNASAQPAALPHKIGLIDMAHVFKEYDKFKALRENLKAEIDQGDQTLRAKAERLRAIQQEMQQFNAGSTEYISRENEILKAKAELEAFQASAQRDFLRKEATIYKTIYGEVEDAIQLYAEYYNYTLIMRFSRDELPDQSDPKGVLQGMNKQVVFWRKEDDITDSILGYLNKNYSASSSSSATRPANPATPAR